MAVPIRHKDILKNYVDNASNAAWARDLVSLAVKTGGVMTDAEHMMVLTEFENGTTVPTIPLPSNYVDDDPKLKLLKLTHVQGVNALIIRTSFAAMKVLLLFMARTVLVKVGILEY